jgi:hypothetical protein
MDNKKVKEYLSKICVLTTQINSAMLKEDIQKYLFLIEDELDDEAEKDIDSSC